MSGGRLIPDSVVIDIEKALVSDNLLRTMSPAQEHKPLTRRERIRGAIWRVRYAIANAIYPYPRYED